LKIRRSVLKQHYREKGFYEYEQVVVPIPRKSHDLVKPFLNRDFEVSVKVIPPPNERLMVILKPKKSIKPP
jgi:hypothetical protein